MSNAGTLREIRKKTMQILPLTTIEAISTQIVNTVTANALVIVAVLGLGLGIFFVMTWFLQVSGFSGGSIYNTWDNYKNRNLR